MVTVFHELVWQNRSENLIVISETTVGDLWRWINNQINLFSKPENLIIKSDRYLCINCKRKHLYFLWYSTPYWQSVSIQRLLIAWALGIVVVKMLQLSSRKAGNVHSNALCIACVSYWTNTSRLAEREALICSKSGQRLHVTMGTMWRTVGRPAK